MTKTKSQSKQSKGLRISSRPTGELSFAVDTKQLKLIKSQSYGNGDYIAAERKRQHLLDTRGTHHIQITKMPNGTIIRRRVPIPTIHELYLN